jgi:chromosome partitioning protein
MWSPSRSDNKVRQTADQVGPLRFQILEAREREDKMCKVIAICNQKGGVGKTSTAVNVGFELAASGKRVLLIDADPQGDLTSSLGIDQPDLLDITIATVMHDTVNDKSGSVKSAIMSHLDGLDFIPANIDLAAIEVLLASVMSREYILREIIDPLKESYDYILIDCMPSLGMITINVLTAAESIIIPVQAQYLPAKGMTQLISTVQKIQKKMNPNLNIMGIVLSMVSRQTNHQGAIKNFLRENYGESIRIFDTEIPFSVVAAETSMSGRSMRQFRKAKNSKVAVAYKEFTQEVENAG